MRVLIGVLVLLSILFLSFCVCVVSAHRLYVVWRISDIEVQAYFGGGTPCRDADVKVYDDKGNLYVSGKTDEKGKFRFQPKAGVNSYKIVVEATHMPGHRAETVLNLSEGASPATSSNRELPLVARIFAGFGYLLGIAGISMIYVSYRQKRKTASQR